MFNKIAMTCIFILFANMTRTEQIYNAGNKKEQMIVAGVFDSYVRDLHSFNSNYWPDYNEPRRRKKKKQKTRNTNRDENDARRRHNVNDYGEENNKKETKKQANQEQHVATVNVAHKESIVVQNAHIITHKT